MANSHHAYSYIFTVKLTVVSQTVWKMFSYIITLSLAHFAQNHKMLTTPKVLLLQKQILIMIEL